MNASKVISKNSIDAAPTIRVRVTSLNGHAEIDALPDSGADISVAGKFLLEQLGEHVDNLLPYHYVLCREWV